MENVVPSVQKKHSYSPPVTPPNSISAAFSDLITVAQPNSFIQQI